MEHHLEIQVITTWNELEALCGIVPKHLVGANTFFQQLPIQKTWWMSHGQPELHTVVVYNAENVVALFPLHKREKVLQLNGHVDVTDYMDVVVEEESAHEAWSAFGQYLHALDGWEYLRLISIPHRSNSMTRLSDIASRHGWNVTQEEQDVCPVILLPETWEEYLQMIGKKQRHEVTRKWRRLSESAKIEFRVVTDTSADPQALETFYTLHKLSSPDKAAFWSEEHKMFFNELSAVTSTHGWLRLYFIDANGEPAAAMYCFDYQDSLLIYNSGFDAEKYLGMSVGNVLTAYTIQDAIALGKKKYDFLRGGEEYKFRYRAQPHPVFDVVVER